MFQYHIDINDEEKLISISASGEIDASIFKQVSNEVAKLYNENGYNVFYDLFDTNLRLSFEDQISVPRNIDANKGSIVAHQVHIAGYVNAEDYSDWKFMEYINAGMGYHAKVFLNKKEALFWLKDS